MHSSINNTNFNYQISSKLQSMTVLDMFVSQANKSPDSQAVRYKNDTLTYHQLNRMSDDLARELKYSGVGRNNIVPFFLDYSVFIPVAVLGILKAGAAFLPLDPEFPEERIKYMLDDCQCKVVVSDLVNEERITSIGHKTLNINSGSKPTDAHETTPELTFPHPSDLSYVIYTSGSTGKPKGVMIQHSALSAYLLDIYERFQLSSCASYGIIGTFSADAGYTAFFSALCFGKHLDIINLKSHSSFDSLKEHFETYPVDCYKTTPSIANLFREYTDVNAILPKKRMILGGEACSHDLAVTIRSLLSKECLFFNHYGPTETTIGIITYEFSKDINEIPDPIPLGIPLPHVTIALRNEKLQPSAIGESGEILVAGPLLSSGYLNNTSATTEKFIKADFNGNHQWFYRTGDIGMMNEDNLIFYLGRNDDQVKINGNRVELKEIKKLIKLSDMTKDSFVTTFDNNQGNQVLVSYIIPQETYDPKILMNLFKRQLPGYMVPGHIIVVDKFPLTVNNKIDKIKLPNPFEETGKSDKVLLVSNDETFVFLHDLWSNILTNNRNIDPNAQFFDLGGNSFSLIKLAFKINSKYGVAITPTDLFNHPTINDLYQLIKSFKRSASKNQAPDLENFDSSEATPGQINFFIKNKLNPSDPFPNSTITFKINGDIDIDQLRLAALNTISRHEGLYTSYIFRKGKLFKNKNCVEDISIMHVKSQDINIAMAEITKSFKLSQAPLMRLFIIETENQNKYLHIDMPHINSDGHTLQILIKSLVDDYNEENTSKTVPQFVEFQKESFIYKHSEKFEIDKLFWKNQITLYKPLLYFKKKFPNIEHAEIGGLSYIEYLPETTFKKIHGFLEGKNMSRFQFFFISYAIFISGLTAVEAIPIMLPVANRNHEGFDEIIGFLSNVTLVNYEVNKNMSIKLVFETCKARLLEVLQHQKFPYEEVLKLYKEKNITTSDQPSLYFGYHQIVPAFKLGDTELSFHLPQSDRENLPLSIALYDTKQSICLRISSKAQIYDRPQLAKIANMYFSFVDTILSVNDEEPVKNLLKNLEVSDITLKQG
jgi:amino acid adenylation domain-containing protein